MKKIASLCALICLSCCVIPSYASNRNMIEVKEFCPKPSDLVMNPADRTWHARGGWKNLNPSFSDKIDTFLGAQWVGVSLGHINCIYTQSGRDTFPVNLQRGLISPAPTNQGGLWSADKGGYIECKSQHVTDCPFLVQRKQAEKDVNKALHDIQKTDDE